MAFRGCSVKTKTQLKVLGWLELVGTTLLVIGTMVSFVMLAVFVAELGDDEVGRSQREHADSLYNRSESDEDQDQYDSHDQDDLLQDKILFQLQLWLTSGISEMSNERAGQVFKARYVGFFGVLAIIVAVFLILHCAATALLMVGVHKKQPGFMLPWVVFAVLGLIGFNAVWFIIFPITYFMYLPNDAILFFLAVVCKRLYFIYLTYRFWRNNKSADLPMTSGVEKQTNWTSDEPLIIPMGLPEHCFDPKK